MPLQSPNMPEMLPAALVQTSASRSALPAVLRCEQAARGRAVGLPPRTGRGAPKGQPSSCGGSMKTCYGGCCANQSCRAACIPKSSRCAAEVLSPGTPGQR